MKKFLTYILFAISCLSPLAQAITRNVTSCDFTDWNNAVTSASNGDFLVGPNGGGTSTWSSEIHSTAIKALLFNFNGCSITTTSGSIVGIAASSTTPARVTGLSCTLSGSANGCIDTGGGAGRTMTRIDHNTFTATAGGKTFIYAYDINPELIDNNTFNCPLNCEMIHNEAFGAANGNNGWVNDVTPGSASMVFIETNTFNNTGTGGSFGGCSAVQSYYGAQTVVRFNTINGCQVDQHGTPGSIGARWWEVYGNTFVVLAAVANQSNYAQIRAGSGVLYNNHKSGVPNTGGGSLEFKEEDTGTWPLAYQIGSGINGQTNGHVNCGSTNNSPSYVWGNDAAMSVSIDGPQVVQNRDIFVSTNQPSSLQRGELSTDTCATTFVYAPFTYPMPLDANGFANPSGTSVTDPQFSPGAGTYTTAQNISITTSTAGATICYTTDGTTPTTNGGGTCTSGTTYTSPVTVSVNQTLNAVGTLSGDADSNVVSAAYIITAASNKTAVVGGVKFSNGVKIK